MSCNDKECFQPECPPKKQEIDCFKLEKVFEECSKTFVAKVKIPLEHPHHAHKVKCVHAHIHPNELACKIDEECSKIVLQEDHVMVHMHANLIDDCHVYPLHAMGLLQIPEENLEFNLKRAGEPGLDCQVEIFAECLDCKITCKSHDDMVSEITCCIGILLIAKLTAKVQVLIPSFGYCPVPEKCKETIPCREEYEPKKVPYPKQKQQCPEKKKEECKEKECKEKEFKEKECEEQECFKPCEPCEQCKEFECEPRKKKFQCEQCEKFEECFPKKKCQPCQPQCADMNCMVDVIF